MKVFNSEQEIFDFVVEFLLKQNKQAKIANLCAYRGEDNTKCAVGCLIPDDIYCDEMEDTGSIGGVIRKAKEGIFNSKTNEWIVENLADHFLLLQRLQHIHDQCYPAQWKEGLKTVAKDYNLEWKYD